ncbi:hypothetical protein V1478_002060 [Vespula squamosa]|uniref:Uncharacterized protein n=1 Tax=Vespula squamosa TaxID=30214 RepID=A0ABD2BZ02_VESSQ
MEFEKRVQRSTAGWSRKPQGKARGPTIGKQRCWWSALAGRKNGDAKVPFEDSYFPRSHGCHTSSAILRLSLHCGNNVRPKQRGQSKGSIYHHQQQQQQQQQQRSARDRFEGRREATGAFAGWLARGSGDVVLPDAS